MNTYRLRFLPVLFGFSVSLVGNAFTQTRTPAPQPLLVGKSGLVLGPKGDKVAFVNFESTQTGQVVVSFNAFAKDGKTVDKVVLEWAGRGTITITRTGVRTPTKNYPARLTELRKIVDLGQKLFNEKLKEPDPENDTVAPLLTEILPIFAKEYPRFWYVK